MTSTAVTRQHLRHWCLGFYKVRLALCPSGPPLLDPPSHLAPGLSLSVPWAARWVGQLTWSGKKLLLFSELFWRGAMGGGDWQQQLLGQ